MSKNYSPRKLNGPIPSLSIENVHRSFVTGKVKNHVLKGITLDILPAELTMIMGPSGSGKSTLLAIMSGLLQPDRGIVKALGTDISSLASSQIDRFRLQHCGFIFQGFNLFSSLTALEQVLLPLKYIHKNETQSVTVGTQVLKEVGLENQINLRPLELSGGEKQRVAIARALVKQPQLIFADEPTSALDSANGQIIISLLQQAARKHGATVFAVTHDPRLISHADRIIQIEDGTITSDERKSKSLEYEASYVS